MEQCYNFIMKQRKIHTLIFNLDGYMLLKALIYIYLHVRDASIHMVFANWHYLYKMQLTVIVYM